MTDTYNALTPDDKSRVFMLAVGQDEFVDENQNFCLGGFAMCPDDSSESWWNTWQAEQRDVYFFYKNSQNEWIHYCHYSMNTYEDDFDDTIDELLVLTSTGSAPTAGTPPPPPPPPPSTTDGSTNPPSPSGPTSSSTPQPTSSTTPPPWWDDNTEQPSGAAFTGELGIVLTLMMSILSVVLAEILQ